MLDDALLAGVIGDAIQGGASFAEVYVERWKRRSMRTHNIIAVGDRLEWSLGVGGAIGAP